MEIGPSSYIFIGLVAATVSLMTLFAGFGLGTLLMPAFALIFPVEIAVAATAVVHGLNGLFKLSLLYRHAVPKVILRFGLPAIGAALVGAWLLTRLSGQDPLLVWHLARRTAEITPVKLVLGTLIVLLAVFDLLPWSRNVRIGSRWLALGGVVSGFLGGLSGHQGALRSAFLLPLGLEPRSFVATQAVLGTMVDMTRILIYGLAIWAGRMAGMETTAQWSLIGVATLCAFSGAFVGTRLLPKISIGAVRSLAGTLLLVIGTALATGLI